MVLCGALDQASACHGVFSFEDLATPLVDDGKLSEGKGVCWGQFSDSFCVQDGFVETAELLLVDGEGHVRTDVIGVTDEDLIELVDAGLQVALGFEFDGCVVKFFGVGFGHGRTFRGVGNVNLMGALREPESGPCTSWTGKGCGWTSGF